VNGLGFGDIPVKELPFVRRFYYLEVFSGEEHAELRKLPEHTVAVKDDR
jgi:hypothetical protein